MDTSQWSSDNYYECSDCEEKFFVTSETGMLVNFCPYCGSVNFDSIEED